LEGVFISNADDDETIKWIKDRFTSFGITRKTNRLINDQGVSWCINLIEILELAQHKQKDVIALARYFAKHPDRVNFSRLDDEWSDDVGRKRKRHSSGTLRTRSEQKGSSKKKKEPVYLEEYFEMVNELATHSSD